MMDFLVNKVQKGIMVVKSYILITNAVFFFPHYCSLWIYV